MRVSYNWLKEFVDLDISPRELADRLTLAGIAVERIEETGKGIEKVVTGRIETISAHPNADKLVVATVNTGAEKLQIITAATNVRAGDVVPVAVEGARLAGGLVIKRASLRGMESRGMMCSGRELGIDPATMSPEEAHGIMLLPPGTPPGRDAKKVLGLDDAILELDLTPNRGDCLSVIGVAREAAALLGLPFRQPQAVFPELEENISGKVKVEIEARDLCRRFVGRLVKNVRVGRSPLWMQQRLRDAGIRPISNIVDVTNYVMLELGQPMHAFDYNLVREGRIIVRRGREGEKITSLDGVERELTPDMLAITDPSGPVAIAGVMGGLATEVSKKTTAVLLEAAYFDPTSIRRTSKALGLRSEASLRFEKGIDIDGCAGASARAVQLITGMEAGEAVAGMVDNYPGLVPEKTLSLRSERATHILGVEVPREETFNILTNLRFKVEDTGNEMLVTVPTYRVDVSREIDLIEEIARMYGYNRVPVTLPYGLSTAGIKTGKQAFLDRIQELLAGSGLYEVVTYSFVHPRVFDRMNLPENSPLRDTVKIQNPLSEENSVMRTMMLPGLLEVLAKNYSRRVQNGAVFETGKVFYPRRGDSLPEERLVLSAASMGRTAGSWNTPSREMDYYYLKGVLENLFRELGTAPVAYRPETANPSFHPGRTASLETGNEKLGVLGELHPDVLEKFDIPEKVTAFELDLAGLLAVSGRPLQYGALPKFPGIERDIAIIVGQDTPAAEIMDTIRSAGGELLQSVSLFDLYRGEPVPEGNQSMAFSLKFQALDRTLTDAEAGERTEVIARALAARFGAELRG